MDKSLLVILFVFSFGLLQAEPASKESVAKEPTAEEVVGEAPTESAVLKAIQPRAEGGRWLYISAYFEDGKKVPAGSSREEVIETKEIEGQMCYLVKLTMDWRSLFDRLGGTKLTEDDYMYYWEYFNEDGSYNYDSADRKDAPESLDEFELTLPYPVEKGHSYETEYDSWTVIDDAAKVSVQAGDFTCVVYQVIAEDKDFPEESTRERYYMAPGVGLVRWEMDFKPGGKWVLDSRDDLIEYRPGKVVK